MQAVAAAVTLAGAVFFGAPGAYAQETHPAPPAQLAPPAPPAAQPAPGTPPAAGTEPAPPPPPAESKIRPVEAAPPVQRRVTTPVIAAGAIGGAGLATGIVFGILAVGDNSKYKKTPDSEVALSGERNAFISDVGFGVAALFGLTAIALYMLPDEPPPPDAAPKADAPKTGKTTRQWITTALKGEVLSF